MHRFLSRLLCATALLYSFSLDAQIFEDIPSPTADPRYAGALKAVDVPVVLLPALDVARAWEEDSGDPGPARFAAPVPADLSPATAGVWTDLPDGSGRLWRCTVQSPGALGLIVLFDRFELPDGGRFYAATADGSRRHGAYTTRSQTPTGHFLIGVLPGDAAVLEYFEPASAAGIAADIHVNRVDYVYDRAAWTEGEVAASAGFGQSVPCNVNVNCPAGTNWQTEKRGVARILMVFANGSGYCSGSLVANTSETYEPYFLTANHCQYIGAGAEFNLWRFDFDYEAPSCSNPPAEPVAKSILGCTRVAYRAETDFMLLKLNPIPSTYGLYFNGWNHSPLSLVPQPVFIHHPNGDIKKISASTQPAAVYPNPINWGTFGSTPGGTHWSMNPTTGAYQGGSSGSPMFDPGRKIVGQLHGGVYDSCTITSTYFGRFDLSWAAGTTPATRLKDWLDPTNTGGLIQGGYAQPVVFLYNIGGTIETPTGQPIPGVAVQLQGSAAPAVVTNAQGQFSFTGIPAGGPYSVVPANDVDPLDGVSTLDLVKISRHILQLEVFDSPWKYIAGDANKSGSVSTFDIVAIRKVLLGIDPGFPGNTSWRFFPAGTVFANPAAPLAGLPGGVIQIANLNADVTTADFIGVKVGDVNDSVMPGQ
jgi:hypothetical protein